MRGFIRVYEGLGVLGFRVHWVRQHALKVQRDRRNGQFACLEVTAFDDHSSPSRFGEGAKTSRHARVEVRFQFGQTVVAVLQFLYLVEASCALRLDTGHFVLGSLSPWRRLAVGGADVQQADAED